ncbi:MAG: FAD:protein FMN transferase [Magnetococcales bacterium]|nr:FAD:protein FMN transferase [Magnetococcales bacterium]NGZ04863.1 FAD:protein FMN transferase [Magnetococcales bacterium]
MNNWRAWAGLLAISGLCVLWLLGSPRQEQEATLSETRLLMGTLVSITTWGHTEDESTRVMELAFAEIDRVEAMMSRFLPASAVTHLNNAPRGEKISALPTELLQLIRQGLEIGQMSKGAFDIGLAPLSDLWGFSREPPPEAPPPASDLQHWLTLRANLPDAAIEITPDHQLRLANAAVGLDLGGIAKGYAVDRAMETLLANGVTNALINAGGDMRLAGSKGDKPWHIGLRDPRQPNGVVAVMDIHKARAISTSGDYERFFLANGVRYHHILDPKTAAPARSGLISVTVQATDSMTADALSTSLFVLGEQEGLKLLQRFPDCEALLIREDGSMVQTSGFIATRSRSP